MTVSHIQPVRSFSSRNLEFSDSDDESHTLNPDLISEKWRKEGEIYSPYVGTEGVY
jgi:hypothetical protein